MNKSENRYNISFATGEQINKIIKKSNSKKATAPNKIPPKIAILSANITDSHLANIINHDLDHSSSDGAKIATARPIYKKNNRDKIENFRPVC